MADSGTVHRMKLLDEIIIPYIGRESGSLQLNPYHPALLIIDVFFGPDDRSCDR